MESKSRTPSPPGKSRNTYIRPHSAKPKKPVLVKEGNEVPVRPMPKLRRPWTAHVSFLGNDTFLCSTEISVLAGVLRDIFFEFCLATFCDVDADFT
jgi:hypothetical protein